MRAMIFSHIDDRMSCKPEWVHIWGRHESKDGTEVEGEAGSQSREQRRERLPTVAVVPSLETV